MIESMRIAIAVWGLLGDVIHDYGYAKPGSRHDLDFFVKIGYPIQDEDL